MLPETTEPELISGGWLTGRAQSGSRGVVDPAGPTKKATAAAAAAIACCSMELPFPSWNIMVWKRVGRRRSPDGSWHWRRCLEDFVSHAPELLHSHDTSVQSAHNLGNGHFSGCGTGF